MSARARSIGGEQAGAGVAGFGHGDGAEFEVGQVSGLRFHRLAGGVGQLRAVADLHGGGLVDDQQADVAQGLAGFLDQPGAGEPEHQDGEGGQAERGALALRQRARATRASARTARTVISQTGQQGIEAEGGDDLFGAHQWRVRLWAGCDPGVGWPCLVMRSCACSWFCCALGEQSSRHRFAQRWRRVSQRKEAGASRWRCGGCDMASYDVCAYRLRILLGETLCHLGVTLCLLDCFDAWTGGHRVLGMHHWPRRCRMAGTWTWSPL